MSHLAKVSLKIKSIPALAAACAEMGLKFHEGKKTYTWYNGKSPCEHNISHDKWLGFEVGVTKTKDGDLTLSYDDMLERGYNGAPAIGHKAGKLMQSYAVAQATAKAKKLGYNVARATTETGAVRLTITGRFA